MKKGWYLQRDRRLLTRGTIGKKCKKLKINPIPTKVSYILTKMTGN